MTTTDQIADAALEYLVPRVNMTVGTREELRRVILKAAEKLAPSGQGMLAFDITASKHGGNAQSNAAAHDGQGRRRPQRTRIWVWLHERGTAGGTVEEISQALEMRYTTVSARCAELKAAGTIRESGQTRRTETGSAAAVLITSPVTS